jgi:transposase
MKKEEIRKEYFKLRIKGHTNNQCRKILLAQFGYEVNIRTLRRWTNKLNRTEWDLKDKSKRPKIIHRKINEKVESKVISLRNKTGWGAEKINQFVKEISESSIKRILRKNNLTNRTYERKKRIKYIR